jgi:hypothetical protein
MTASVSTVILRSMRMIGEAIRGDTLDANEQVECLQELNSFMDGESIKRLMCYTVGQESFTLTANTVSYTIGPGATFNTTRPTKIVDPCFVRDANSYDSPLQIIDADTYGKLKVKNVGTTYPTYLFYDSGFDSSGFGTITVYPAPSSNLTLYINSWKQLQQFANVSTALLLPPGYQLFIESNFAIHLAAGLTPVSAEVIKIAKESRAAIESLNIPDVEMRLEGALVGAGRSRSSILTGP